MTDIDKSIKQLKVIEDILSKLMDNPRGHSRPQETMLLRWLTRIVGKLAKAQSNQ